LGHKPGMKIGATGGRVGTGHALPPYICLVGGDGHGPGVYMGPPDGDGKRHVWQPKNVATDKDGEPLKVVYSHNTTGAMNSERCMAYMINVTIPAMGNISTEPGCGGVEVVNGCSCHLSYERMKKGAELGLSTCLRVPYSSFATQGEDKVHFRILKPAGVPEGEAQELKEMMQNNYAVLPSVLYSPIGVPPFSV